MENNLTLNTNSITNPFSLPPQQSSKHDILSTFLNKTNYPQIDEYHIKYKTIIEN